jgi:hypothetical protein
MTMILPDFEADIAEAFDFEFTSIYFDHHTLTGFRTDVSIDVVVDYEHLVDNQLADMADEDPYASYKSEQLWKQTVLDQRRAQADIVHLTRERLRLVAYARLIEEREALDADTIFVLADCDYASWVEHAHDWEDTMSALHNFDDLSTVDLLHIVEAFSETF